jgi:hypothetical protein
MDIRREIGLSDRFFHLCAWGELRVFVSEQEMSHK